MPKYTVIISKKATKKLDKLSDHIANPIISAINQLIENPKPQGSKKLKGRDGFRIRVNDYRIIYEIIDEELIIDVIHLGHRKEVYL